MSDAEVHEFGIQVVVDALRRDGYEVTEINTGPTDFPAIVARKATETAFVLVRTGCYPETGHACAETGTQMLEIAEKWGVTPYFASVGICNQDAQTEEEKGVPVRGAGFSVSFDGLRLVMRSDRVHGVFGQGKV